MLLLLNLLELQECNLTLTFHGSWSSLTSLPVLSELFVLAFAVTIGGRQDRHHHGCSQFNCGISSLNDAPWFILVCQGQFRSSARWQNEAAATLRHFQAHLWDLMLRCHFFLDRFWPQTEF